MYENHRPVHKIEDYIDFKSKDETIAKIKSNQSIKFLRIVWTDIPNLIRTKSVSVQWLLDNKDDFNYVCVTNACMALPGHADSIVKDALPSDEFGEVYLVPDWTSYTVLPYCSNTAQVFGSFYCNDMSNHGSVEPWSLCPRHALRKAIEKLSNVIPTAVSDYSSPTSSYSKLHLMGAFEVEFYLIKEGSNQFSFASSYALDEHQEVLLDITESLYLQNVPVEQLLAESGPNQFEITIPYTNIQLACDRHIIARQTIHQIAKKHGYIASLIPKVYEKAAGTGCHAHLSLWGSSIKPKEEEAVERSGNTISSRATEIPPKPKNLIPHGKDGISEIAKRAISGVLHHSKSLTAFYNANPNSYQRLQPNCWSGAFVAWGVNNKEAMVRVPTSSSFYEKGGTNFEIKTIDHSSNPYLAMALTIYAIIEGLTNPSISNREPTSVNPSQMKPEIIKKLGIESLPYSLTDALDIFINNKYLIDNMGADISKAYYHVKLCESKDFGDDFQRCRDTFLTRY